MAPPPPHDATLSELAYEAWGGPMELEISQEQESALVKVRGRDDLGPVLRLSHDLVVKITRALCIGRTHRARVVQAHKDERELTTRLLDKRGIIEVLQLRKERAQRLLETPHALDSEGVQGLEDLLQRFQRCRHDEQTLEQNLKDLKTYQQEDLEAWKTAWLSVDKILDKVWTKADLLQDDDSNSGDEDDDDNNHQGPGENEPPAHISDYGSGGHHGGHPTRGQSGHSRRSKEDNNPTDADGQSGQLSREAVAEKQRAWRALMNEQDKAVEAARTEWEEYVKNFKEEFAKYENQLDSDAQEKPNFCDKFRRETWMPKVLELGQIMNERMKIRKEVAKDAARIADYVADISEATQELIDKDYAAYLQHWPRIGVDRWLEKLTNDPKEEAIDEVSWPRDKDVYDEINAPEPTIEVEDSSSYRGARELLARLERDEHLPDHERMTTPRYEMQDCLMRSENSSGRCWSQTQVLDKKPLDKKSLDKENRMLPTQMQNAQINSARSASQEHSETSSRKRRHIEGAHSNMSKTQKRVHGENAGSRLQGTIADHDQDSTQQEERSRSRRELPWEMRPRAVSHPSQSELSNTAKPPPKPRKQLKPSAREFFAAYAKSEYSEAEA